MPIPSAAGQGLGDDAQREEDEMNIGKPIRTFLVEPILSPVPRRKRTDRPVESPPAPAKPTTTPRW